MIMAERAADGLAKLGLYSASCSNGNNQQSNACNGMSNGIGVSNGDEPMDTSGASTAPVIQTNGLAANPINGFNIHHRRSKSLRERTGVDQRLERLPSGPPPGQKSVLWTVIKGTNVDKRSVELIFYLYFTMSNPKRWHSDNTFRSKNPYSSSILIE